MKINFYFFGSGDGKIGKFLIKLKKLKKTKKAVKGYYYFNMSNLMFQNPYFTIIGAGYEG